MIKENISEILKPLAEQAQRFSKTYQNIIQQLEVEAMLALKMDTTLGTDGKLFIKIYADKTIEIRHRTNDGTYYYYPLNPDHTDPWQCKPKERFYAYDFKKTYRKGWKK